MSTSTHVTTSRTVLVAPEVCPVCGSGEVRVIDADWFAIELERSDQLREVTFACHECGCRWD